MNNLFIVNTPFHLLTTFILSHSFFANDTNYLALIHPHSFEKWADNPVMNYMSSTQCGYKKVFPLINFLSSKNKTQSYKSQVKNIHNEMDALDINNVFLGSDIDPQNQLLVATLNINKFNRFEDGLYSYYNKNRRRSTLDAAFHKTRIWGLKKLSGITGDLYINTSTSSSSKAGLSDYMYKPNLLQRYSPKTIEINSEAILSAIKELIDKDLLHQTLTVPSILYLSQPLVEKKLFTINEELNCLKTLLESLPNNSNLLYKPHPNDHTDKIAYFKKNLPQMIIFNSVQPAELLYATEINLKAVASYQSTALMYIDKFATHPIKSISLSDFAKSPMHPKYKEIMQNAGVYFPETLIDITNYLKF